MSENNDLNEVFTVTFADSEVITVPIDDTLSNSGEAADAAAVGAALDLKADRSELQTAVKVNGQSADAQGLILVNAGHIPLSSQDSTTVASKLTTIDGKTGLNIKIDDAQDAQTVKQAVDAANNRKASQIQMSVQDSTTVETKVTGIEEDLSELAEVVEGLDEKTAADIKYAEGSEETIKEHVDAMGSGNVKSVNEVGPDASGNVELETVPYADNLTSDAMTEVEGSFVIRTSGGAISLNDGPAWALKMLGNRVHNGFTQESLNMTVIPMPRTAPAAITASLNEDTFEAYVEVAGTYTMTYDGYAWSTAPELYGVTVLNTPIEDDLITIVWDGENDAVMTVSAAPRTAPPAITATIDRDTFVAYVSESGTTTLTYTTSWSASPALYGITVQNEPVAGDQIVVVYVKEVRGIIVQSDPQALIGTGWNLYNHTEGYARVCRYSDSYGYKVGGTYTSLAFAEDPDDENPTTITPDANGLFNVTGDGYVIVTGGDATTTYIYTTWSDWIATTPTFEAYTEHAIDLSTIMAARFPYGLLRVGNVRDEINFVNKKAIVRVERQTYSAENRAAAEESGRAYEFDENYIYLEKETADEYTIQINDKYEISEHGMEFFADTDVEVYLESIYGTNLKDKLKRDVVTKSEDLVNGFTETGTGKALDARAGKTLNEAIANLQDGLAIVATGNTHAAIPAGAFVYVKNHNTLSDGLYTNKSGATIAANDTLTSSNLQAESSGGFNTLNNNLTTINNKIDTLNMRLYRNTDINNDLNNAKETGLVIYTNGEASSISNRPQNDNSGKQVIVTRTDIGNDADVVQIALDRLSAGIGNVYMRNYINGSTPGTGTWTPWRRFLLGNGIDWGTTFTIQCPYRICTINVGANTQIQAWLPGTAGINIVVRDFSTNETVFKKESTTNSITFGYTSSSGNNFTLTRSELNITFTSSSNVSAVAHS